MSKKKIFDPETLELRIKTVLSVDAEWPEWIEYDIEFYANTKDIWDSEYPDDEPMHKVGTAHAWRFLAEYSSDDYNHFDMTGNMYMVWNALFTEESKEITCDLGQDGYDFLYLDDIIIEEEYRSQGIGTAAMGLIEKYLGTSCGLFALIAQKDKNLALLRKWYGKLGFNEVEQTRVMYKSLL